MAICWPAKINVPVDISPQVNALEEANKQLEEKKVELQNKSKAYDELAKKSIQKDSLLNIEITKNELYLQQLSKLYEKIPVYNSYNTDSIVRYFSKNYGNR